MNTPNTQQISRKGIENQLKKAVTERAEAIKKYITAVNEIIQDWGAIVNSIGDLSNSAKIENVKTQIIALSGKIDSQEFKTLQATAGTPLGGNQNYLLANHWFKLTPDNFNTLKKELQPQIRAVIEQEEAKFKAASAAFTNQSAAINNLQEELKNLLKAIKGTVNNNNVKINRGQAPVKPNSVFKEFKLEDKITEEATKGARELEPPNTSKISKINTTVVSGTGAATAAANNINTQ